MTQLHKIMLEEPVSRSTCKSGTVPRNGRHGSRTDMLVSFLAQQSHWSGVFCTGPVSTRRSSLLSTSKNTDGECPPLPPETR